MWTYDATKLALLGRDTVRFLSRNTNSKRQLVLDEEIDFLLTREANVYMAAAAAADNAAAASQNITDEQAGSARASFNSEFYTELAAKLRARGSSHAIPTAGEISRIENTRLEEDEDRMKDVFSEGMNDNHDTFFGGSTEDKPD